jgi:hypothetical protein
MRIHPFLYLDTLDDAAVARHNCSDRIWVHHTIFSQWIHSEAETVSLVRLMNRLDQSVIGCVFGIHYGEPDDLYVPQWMHHALEFDTEEVTMTRVSPSLCTGIVLQPHTSDHLRVTGDPLDVLRDGFEQYSVLSPGQTLDLWVGEQSMTCTILSLLPTNDAPLAIRNCELTLQLMPPLDMPIPEPATSVVTAADAAHSEAAATSAEPLASSELPSLPQEDQVVQRRRLAEAARNRLMQPKS